uniref:Uncharacterized protein LOC111110813 n=1 Tax=Crassostrea virginica TaxID=6565 RepID=A0A8B8BIN4_CRAVI|nr:uncharacterized protein LOC111110813 [Crassostrea virginica]XP_022303138.1 uncharacterized protein LOC111110813 [Crassostrea virginica]
MPVDNIRNMLAIMDQNYHKDRHVATTLNDNPYLSKDKNKGCIQKTKNLNVACMLSTYGKSVRSFTKSTNAQELETVYKNLSGKANLGSSQLIDQIRNRKKPMILHDAISASRTGSS